MDSQWDCPFLWVSTYHGMGADAPFSKSKMGSKILAVSNMNQKPKKKSYSMVTRIKELFSLNIGTIIFGAIFLYMIISIILYLTANKFSAYQVTAGPLAKNQTYTGLAVREEQVVTADTSGYLTYYARENAKVKKSGVVYSIGENQSKETTVELTDTALRKLKGQMSSFSNNFNLTDYNDIYGFKSEIEGSLLQYSGVVAPSASGSSGSITVGDQTICSAPDDGLVLYSIDGYEDFKAEDITAADINTKSLHVENLKTKERVNAGQPVYKIITSESWSLLIPLTDKQIVQLSDRSSIRVKFLKDGATQVAGFVIHTNADGTYYGELTFNSGLVRYSGERFLDIELVTNTQSGLKIPISSIVNKEFYTIPEEYATKGGDSSDIGFLRESKSENGETTTEFVHVTLYENKGGVYYVNKADFNKDDVIIKSDSNDRYIIGSTDSLEGVYCINRGYAVFRKIVIIDKNDTYCIVETGTSYGLAQFDHIVEDSTTVNEEDILY